VEKAQIGGPSVPVEIYGISGVPMAGDEFIVLGDEKAAKQVIEHRRDGQETGGFKERDRQFGRLFKRIKDGEIRSSTSLPRPTFRDLWKPFGFARQAEHGRGQGKNDPLGHGAITESDVMLASASGSHHHRVHVRANPRVVEIAEKEKVDIRYYDVI